MKPPREQPAQATLKQRVLYFLNPFDGRYEDLLQGRWYLNVLRDFTAGLIVAMVAIPLAMGFAMASGLEPEQGIVGGAVAGLMGALFGGSKYQVYGPTAAFIPVIGAIMENHDHAFLVLASGLAGLVLIALGLFRFGRVVNLVPHSIVVGFTIGIAVTIALSQVGEILGLHAKLGYDFLDKMRGIAANLHEFNPYALVIALFVLICTRSLMKISVFIPGPLVAIALATVGATYWLADKGLTTVHDKFGEIPTHLWKHTPHGTAGFDYPFALAYYVAAIVFVCAIESLLCSRMADRLANNQGMPFSPDKELWGQGWVQVIVPMLNGFPHTGALARTATNIKLGAISPLAGIFKCFLKLLLAYHMASYLEMVPMPCIGGILLYVAMNMVKKEEVQEVKTMGRFHWGLMIYTAFAVIVTDFLTGVLSALVLAVLHSLTSVRAHLIPEEGYWRARIEGALTFVSSPKVLQVLEDIPQGQTVVLDLHLRFMEMAGWKTLMDWCDRYRASGGRVEMEGFYGNPDDIVPPR